MKTLTLLVGSLFFRRLSCWLGSEGVCEAVFCLV